MSDRELLEAAAKAAGIVGEVDEFYLRLGDSVPILGINNETGAWFPLTDDGDALRLAVQLGLSVQVCYDSVQPLPWLRVTTRCQRWEHAMTDEYAADPYAATRRAIVRAAAAIATKGEPT